MSIPVVAIVGRPNVGKSTIFNRIIGKKISIVDDVAGVTRDRIYAKSEWAGFVFNLVDAGGFDDNSEIVDFSKEIVSQLMCAIMGADVVVFVTDFNFGVTNLDLKIANILRKVNKPVVLCVNKCDSIGEISSEFYEFYSLWPENVFAISAVHGYGFGDFLDKVVSYFKNQNENEFEEDAVKVAIVGRPNAGKSSLINKLIGENRVIVSEIAGTTRDAIDVFLKCENENLILTDTAGIRKKSKIKEDLEKYSVIRAKMAIERSDVCLIMIDAVEGFAEQDSKIAGVVNLKGKACIVVVNKWDLIKGDENSIKEYSEKLKKDFSFISFVPFVFISAKTGLRLKKLIDLISNVNAQSEQRFSTGTLNELLGIAMSRIEPPAHKGKKLKIYYVTQVAVKPPVFVFFVNCKDLFHFSYQRYLENQIRKSFGFVGVPIKFIIRERGEKNLWKD